MALFKSKKTSTPLANLVSAINAQMLNKGAEFTSKDLAGACISIEGRTAVFDNAELSRREDEMGGTLKSLAGEALDLDEHTFSEASLEAATFAAMSAGDLSAFDGQALFGDMGKGVEMQTDGIQDFRVSASLEAFDASKSSEAAPYTIAFNLLATEQSDFEKTFYPIKTLGINDLGFSVTISFDEIHKEQYHNSDGSPAPFIKVPLMNAAVDHTILENNACELIPVYQPKSASKFVDAALLPPRIVLANGIETKTSAIKVNESVSLLGLCQDAGTVGGQVFTSEDSIDPRMLLKTITLSITDGTTVDIIETNVENLIKSGFRKDLEGDPYEYNINFRTEALSLSKNTKNISNVALQSIKTLTDGDMSARLDVRLGGDINIETGVVCLNATPAKIGHVFSVDGTELGIETGAVAGILSKIKVEVVGYTLFAHRTNNNFRTRGLLVGTRSVTDRHIIYPRRPITSVSPINGQDTDSADLATLINTTKTAMKNDAVSKLFAYADSLKRFDLSVKQNGPAPAIEGAARLLLTPFYEEINFAVDKVINTTRTADKASDIKAGFVNTVRDGLHRMIRDSGFNTAVAARVGGSSIKPLVIIATDEYIKSFLMIDGDADTFGRDVKFKICEVEDKRMYDEIFITVTLPNVAPNDPLSFGGCGWTPQVTRTLQTTRDNSTVRESSVQPRYRHVNNLPLLIRIKVTGLTAALRLKSTDAMRDTGIFNV